MRRVLLYSLYLGLTTIILLEVVVRLWGYSQRYIYDPIYMPGEPQEIPFVMKPNLAGAKGQSNTLLNTDALGLRSLHPGARYEEKRPGEYRIAFMGDSFTFGQGVANQETFPEVVSQELNARQTRYRVAVFNFGVSSYNVKTMADTLRYRAIKIKPDLAVMCLIYDDFDLERTGVVDKYGYTVTRLSISQVDNRIKLFFRHVHLSYLFRDLIRGIGMMLQPERGENPAPAETLPQSYRYIVDFKNFSEANAINYVVIILPGITPSDQKILQVRKQFVQDGIRYDDLFYLADSIKAKDFRISQWDTHPSALVHRQIGEQVSRYILDHFLTLREQQPTGFGH